MSYKISRFKEGIGCYLKSLYIDLRNINKSNIRVIIKKRAKLIVGCALIIFMCGGYLLGLVNSTQSRVLGDLEVALKEGDASKLRSEVRLDGQKVSMEELEPLIDYYTGDSSKVDSTIQKLKAYQETEAFELVTDDGIFGTKYYIELKSYEVKVNSNFNEGNFTLNQKDYVKGMESIKKIIPGVYTLEGSLESEFGDIKASKEVIVMKEEEVNLDFFAVKINVTSVYEDAKLYINDNDTEIKVKDAKEIGPIPSDGTVSVHIERDFPWGYLKGEQALIKDTPNLILNISMENDEMKSDMSLVSKNFYNSVFNALNEGNKSSINNATEETKEKIYDILEKRYIFLKNKYTIENIDIMDEKTQYVFEDGVYRATLVVKVDYEIKKNFFGLNKSNDSKMFFTKLVYNDEAWEIEDVENFSL
jgi:uncharacterized membrane protein YvbJ